MHIAIQSTTPKHYILKQGFLLCKKSPLMEKNLLLQAILHWVNFILGLQQLTAVCLI